MLKKFLLCVVTFIFFSQLASTSENASLFALVADYGTSKIYKVDLSTEEVTLLIDLPSDIGDLPRGIAIGPNNNIFISVQRGHEGVLKFDMDGQFISTYGPSLGGFGPGEIEFMANGDLLIAGDISNGSALYRFSGEDAQIVDSKSSCNASNVIGLAHAGSYAFTVGIFSANVSRFDISSTPFSCSSFISTAVTSTTRYQTQTMTITADGNLLVIPQKGTSKVYDSSTGEFIEDLLVSSELVNKAVYSSIDERYYLVGANTIQIYNSDGDKVKDITNENFTGLNAIVVYEDSQVEDAVITNTSGGLLDIDASHPQSIVVSSLYGYIQNAEIYVDRNEDSVANAEELLEEYTTDEFGRLTLPESILSAPENIDKRLIIKGGINVFTGMPNGLELEAPVGYDVINPLSTIVATVVDNGLDLAEAETKLAEAFGIELDGHSAFGSYDPLLDTYDHALENRVILTQIATLLTMTSFANDLSLNGGIDADQAVLSNLAGIVTNWEIGDEAIILDPLTVVEVLTVEEESVESLQFIINAVEALALVVQEVNEAEEAGVEIDYDAKIEKINQIIIFSHPTNDADNDGLTALEEFNLGTSPTNDDTDRDTLHDGWEVENGRNPLVADYQISSGDRHACAIILGEVECWGYNPYGQINAPDLNNPQLIAAGYDHNCALHGEGVTCWGRNFEGQTNVPVLENPVDIAAGGYHSCALDDKNVVCWGSNSYGQTNVPDLSNPIAIETGLNHTCAIDDTGAVCWGSNSDGQISVPLIDYPISLSLGFFHSCALTEDEVVCWGRNSYGQIDVPILQSPKLVDADGYFTCAIDDNGIVCWGEDTNGQTNSPSIDATDISSGGHFSCALSEIAVECWGRSTFGELDVPSELTDLSSNSFIGQNDEVTAPGNTIDYIDTDNDGLADDFDTDDEADGIYEGQNFSLESLKANFLSPYRPLVHGNDQLEIGTSENSPNQEILWRIPVLDNDNLDDSDKFTVTIEIEEVRVPGLDRDFIVGISDGSKVVNFANAGLGYTGIWIADDMVDRLSHTLVNSNNFGDDHTYYSATFAFTNNTCHLTFTDLISNNQSEHSIQLESGTFGRSKGLELVLIGNEADENFVMKALSITYPDIDSDGDGIFNLDDTDDDNDGAIDEFDAFPLNPQEQMDTDSDGIGNNADTDADNDGIMNEVDSFPYDAFESADSDGDGVGDNADFFPNSAEYSLDSDLDQMPDAWERKYGLNPTDASDALLDQDNDGLTALEEYEAGTIPLKILDIDANGSFDALTDGLIILRYAFGLRGENLVRSATAGDAMRTDAADVEAYLNSLVPGL